MQLVLRKCATDEVIRLSGTKLLCRNSRKLALLAAYSGQWLFYSLPVPASARVLYNRLPAPPRCPVAVGDLLDLNGLQVVVDSIEAGPGALATSTSEPLSCAIEGLAGGSIRITQDVLLGYDPRCGLCLSATLDFQQLTALLTFAAGCWHLHDLSGNSLIRNGKAAGLSLVLADGDRLRIHDKELRFHIDAVIGVRATPPKKHSDERDQRGAASRDTATMSVPSTRAIDLVYRGAKELCQQLWPILREPGRTFQPRKASWGGIREWLKVFRRPSNPAETLERLRFLLSGSPRDRVWLFELARFLFQQSYPGLCLRVLKELNRLYPDDADAAHTLAKFYFQQGCNPRLPGKGRLNAFEHAERCTQRVRQLAPNDRSLADLEEAVRVEQTALKNSLARMTPCEVSLPEPADVVGRMA